ncbi:MAG: transcription antitermination factor NusB [Pseudomonadota bacterium]
MGSRRRAREQALQVLYLIDLTGMPGDAALNLFKTNFESEEEDFDFVCELVRGVLEHQKDIDELIEKHAENWKLSRMPRIDRNIIRLGAYQILHRDDIPPAVALDESVELGKRFGEEKTPAYVNGVLDRIFRERPNRV